MFRRYPPKLFIDRNRQIKASSPGTALSDSSDQYLTPNSTLDAGSPKSLNDETVYKTPDTTMKDNKYLPSYFDRKKQNIISLAKSAAHVLPLHNFHIFKQKSLNTIPDFIERQTAKEQKENESELFHNFPFLTPLAHRKNSIHDKSRLSSCNEDDFYLTTNDIDLRHPLRSAGFLEGKTFDSLISNRISHSTPKPIPTVRKSCTVDCGSKPGLLENPFSSVNPLRHSYTTHSMAAESKSNNPLHRYVRPVYGM